MNDKLTELPDSDEARQMDSAELLIEQAEARSDFMACEFALAVVRSYTVEQTAKMLEGRIHEQKRRYAAINLEIERRGIKS